MNAGSAAEAVERRAWLRLALAPEVGPVLAHRLLASFGHPSEIFDASAAELGSVPGLGPARLAGLLGSATQQAAHEEWQRLNDAGLTLLTLHDEAYPPLLRRMEHPPLVLWVRGALMPQDRLGLAVVGPRQPSAYARLMVEQLVPALATQGLTIISGLAFGIDATAHRAAIDAGGRTLAVVGQGLATALYPQANQQLAQRIVEEGRGALLSIFPCGTEPASHHFPQRNEVIAGLALGTLVIEASVTSGTLITARQAAAAGRTVLACPGDATRRQAQGSNRLLAEGAVLVQTAEDVLHGLAAELRREMAELGADAPAADTAADDAAVSGNGHESAPVDPLAAALLAALAEEPRPLDSLLEAANAAGYPLPATLERLLQMELTGQVRQLPGRIYARRV